MKTDPAKATTTRGTFRMACSIRTVIHASADTIWSLLTDAASMPRWNSTVESVSGAIAEGARLAVKVPAAPGRVFRPRVSRVEAGRSMVWSDGVAPMFRGVRTYTLTPNADGSTDFAMREVFSGLMLPMISGSLPDFAPVFETYAADLKRAAEGTAA
jgi:hypothetical protein